MKSSPARQRPFWVAPLLLLLLVGAAQPAAQPVPEAPQPASAPSPTTKSSGAGPAQPVRISGVLFDGRLTGDPEPEEAVRLTNTRTDAELVVADFKLSDRFGPQRHRAKERKERGSDDPDLTSTSHTVSLPTGARIPPSGDLWVAHTAKGFRLVFGFDPDFEAVDTDPGVPNLGVQNGWLDLPAQHGVVSLHDASGELIDVVAFDRGQKAPLDLSAIPESAWRGPAVQLDEAQIFGWQGQILARDRDEDARLLADTDSATDWDSGISHKQLGVEPTHRLELPGQSHFVEHPLRNVEATVRCASSPENNFAAMGAAFDGAAKSIRVSIYKFTNDLLADHLVAALQRGVAVTVWTEGSPVGGLEDQSRYILDRLASAGAKVYFLVRDATEKVSARYRFDHSKFVIIDDKLVAIGTENFGRTGHPVDPSYGNRGFEIFIEHEGFAQQLLDVWHADVAIGHSRDARAIDARSDDPYGKPFKNPKFMVDRTVVRGLFDRPQPPKWVKGRMDLTLVLSPDTSLNENSSLLGLMRDAKKELLVLQNSVPLHWGKKDDSIETAPNLALQAVVAAARRGARTRVLVDGTWYNAEPDDARDNDDSVAYLNELARTEHLDLEAKVVNLFAAHLEKIHAKSVIVDGQRIFIGSINWSENSFKGNREVGVIVGNRDVTDYYRTIFWGDWYASRLYSVEVSAKQANALQRPSDKAKAIKKLLKGDRLVVVSEVGGSQAKGPAYLEVQLGGDKTGYVPTAATGQPILAPEESGLHTGRTVRIEGRVLAADAGEKVTRLRFTQGKGFVAVVLAQHANVFQQAGIDPERAFTGKRVAVDGVLKVFGGSPEIMLKSPKQITILPEQ